MRITTVNTSDIACAIGASGGLAGKRPCDGTLTMAIVGLK